MSDETDREVRRVDRRRMRLAQIILMALGAFLLGAHVFKWDVVQVDKPTKNIYILDQDALDSLLEGYEEYAEFIVSVEEG